MYLKNGEMQFHKIAYNIQAVLTVSFRLDKRNSRIL
jgi:hypothetical protein